jgi:hypothetical protein
LSGEIIYPYSTNGLSTKGGQIPDVPVVHLSIKREDKNYSVAGQALVDTGFDGGLYPNLMIIEYLEGLKPTKIEELDSVRGPITCEVFRVVASFVEPETGETMKPIGEIDIYVPTSPEALSDEVILGREVLNTFNINLDGKRISIIA